MAGTITEILAEAFNRIKTEHGVTLSRVEFAPTIGGVGLSFKAAGCYVELRDPMVESHPDGATHFGPYGDSDGCYWKFESGELYLWDSLEWLLCDDDIKSAQRTVDKLTPLDGSPPYQP